MDEHLELRHVTALMERIGEPLEPYERPKSGRPDFVKIIDGATTGIEVTRLVPEEVMRALNQQAKENPDRFIHLTPLRHRDKADRRPNDEVGKNLTSPHNPCVVARNTDDRFIDYCELVTATANKKRAKLNQPDCPRHDRNWLLMFDPIGGHLDRTLLRQGLVRRDPGQKDFDRIYIYSGGFWLLWEDGDLRLLQTHCLMVP